MKNLVTLFVVLVLFYIVVGTVSYLCAGSGSHQVYSVPPSQRAGMENPDFIIACPGD